mmetsp:Transcript_8640/g.23725  ORF Transcript_8640/g.23725 Transcript_8640/m.23725 type:complete len:471 (+) Transcript_8640:50-1462(+)
MTSEASHWSPPPASPTHPLIPRDEKGGRSQTPARRATLAGSVFNLCAATLGAGALALPYTISQTGVALGATFLCVAAGATLLSIDLLVSAMETSGLPSYEALTFTLVGRRTAACVEGAIFAFCFGTCVAYLIALGDIAQVVLVDSGAIPPSSRIPSSRIQWMLVAWAFCLVPLSLPKTLVALQQASFLGTAALCCLVAAICAHSATAPPGTNGSNPGATELTANPAPRELTIAGLTTAMSTTMFAFTSQVNVPEVYNELPAKSTVRMRFVAASAIGTALVLYLVISIAAFSEFGTLTKEDVLANYDVIGGDGRDRAMQPAFAFISCTIMMAFPLNVFPARHTLLAAMAQTHGEADVDAAGPTLFQHVAATMALTGGALVLAIFAPGISMVFSLLGGTASAFVCFCVPGILALRARVPAVHTREGLAGIYVLIAGGAFIGVLATSITIRDLVTSSGSVDEDSVMAPPYRGL